MFYACLSPLEIVHNLWYSAPLLLGTLICIISSKAEILKSPQFLKEAQRFGNPPRPKQSTLEMKSHQCDLVVHTLVCALEKRKACLFSDTQENCACGWIWRSNQSRRVHIQAEATSHSGEVVDKWPRFCSLYKRVNQLNRSFTK